jgi:signal transduction histidine kinase/ActR/RegA family two-component response regulator
MTTERRTLRVRGVLLRRSVPYGLFAIACALSVSAGWYVSTTAAAAAAAEEQQAHSEFLTDAQQTRRYIQSGLNSYFEAGRTGAVLLSADNEINGSEFRAFVNRLRLPERYPGMDGIGFAQCVRRRDLGRFLRILDLDGNGIRVWPASDRAERCPTIFLAPTNASSRTSSGFDLASEPVLAETMAQARDTGEPTASPNLRGLPVWKSGEFGRVVLFYPVYRGGTPPTTVAARRRASAGFVFSPLDPERLLAHLTESPASVAYEVYDGPSASPENQLARSGTAPTDARYTTTERVQVAGREWFVAVHSLGTPVAAGSSAAHQTVIGGLILSLILLVVTRAQVDSWEGAARQEAELQASAQALRDSESEARAANRAKDDFLATLSHELRTPLNVVLGWVSMLRHGTVREDRLEYALEMIERNARQQAQLIDDLLDVSRIAAGKVRFELRPLIVASVVSAVLESLRPSAEAKDVSLTVRALSQDAAVMGDPDRLRQTIWNLIANAIKFTPAGGEVWVELTRQDNRVRITVGDTGIGIAPTFLPFVFERFRQADSSTTREHGGVGLGLAIARELVELQGGTIEAHSSGPGSGAVFVVELPEVSAAHKPAPAAQALSNGATPQLNGVRVLVVDDDPSTLDLLHEALSTMGAKVTAADSARQALARLQEHGADVIVSDIAMPGEDGLWLMRHVRALSGERGQTPAIALTALARVEDRARIINAGYQMHLPKPVRLGELQTGVAAVVAERALYINDRAALLG